ncbi:MAG: hypothetical protein AAFR60_11120, partial [Pseudomonadota bacterium]
ELQNGAWDHKLAADEAAKPFLKTTGSVFVFAKGHHRWNPHLLRSRTEQTTRTFDYAMGLR